MQNVFMPINPINGRRAPYSVEDFQEQLTRHGIEMPELDEGSDYYSLQLPTSQHGVTLEQDVMIVVEDENVIGVVIDEPKRGGETFWLHLMQMGYVLQDRAKNSVLVSASWAAQFQKSGVNLAGITQIDVIKSPADFLQYGF